MRAFYVCRKKKQLKYPNKGITNATKSGALMIYILVRDFKMFWNSINKWSKHLISNLILGAYFVHPDNNNLYVQPLTLYVYPALPYTQRNSIMNYQWPMYFINIFSENNISLSLGIFFFLSSNDYIMRKLNYLPLFYTI